MTKIERVNDEIEEDEVHWGTPSTHLSTQESISNQETDMNFFWEDNDVQLSTQESQKESPNKSRLAALKKRMVAKARQRNPEASPSFPALSQSVNIGDGGNTFQTLLEECNDTSSRGDSHTKMQW